MVFQSAMNALNPVLTMEEQFCDVLMRHTNMSRKDAIRRAQGLLEIVDIHPDRLRDYPHQFSGGMRQRLVIAIALALNPKMIIMDEQPQRWMLSCSVKFYKRSMHSKKSLDFLFYSSPMTYH